MNNGVTDLVSIVIPAYNRAHLIGECIDSVLAQTYPAVEIIVIDDGSTDETREVLRRFDGKIVLVCQENGGQASARKAGLAMARGQFVAFLDSDDFWDREFLDVCVSGIKRARCAMFFTNYRKIDRGGQRTVADGFDVEREWLSQYMTNKIGGVYSLEERETREMFVGHLPPGCSASVFLKKHVMHYPDPKARMGDDLLFFMDYALSSPIRISFTERVLSNIRIHDANLRVDQTDYDKVGRNDVYVRSELLRKHRDSLSAYERSIFRKNLADEFFHWGHRSHLDQKPLKAATRYLRSFLAYPSMKSFKAMLKMFLLVPFVRRAG